MASQSAPVGFTYVAWITLNDFQNSPVAAKLRKFDVDIQNLSVVVSREMMDPFSIKIVDSSKLFG